MANTLNTQIMLDGPRNSIIKVEGFVDTSDLVAAVIIDPATLSGIDRTLSQKALKLRILQCDYIVEDLLSVGLAWQATAPVTIASLEGRGKLEARHYGGLVNGAGAGVTGAITLSTQGWVAGAILSFSLVFELLKQGR